MGADGYLDDPAPVARLDNENLAAGGMDADAEAFQVVIPDDVLAVAGLHRIDGAFRDSWHWPSLAPDPQVPYRYL